MILIQQIGVAREVFNGFAKHKTVSEFKGKVKPITQICFEVQSVVNQVVVYPIPINILKHKLLHIRNVAVQTGTALWQGGSTKAQ